MKPEQQRIAIAIASGWRFDKSRERQKAGYLVLPGDGLNVTVWRDGTFGSERHLPDYLNDLNAMHAAEARLSDEQWEAYLFELNELIGHNHRVQFAVSATAGQRAEAFLRTLGLWGKPV